MPSIVQVEDNRNREAEADHRGGGGGAEQLPTTTELYSIQNRLTIRISVWNGRLPSSIPLRGWYWYGSVFTVLLRGLFELHCIARGLKAVRGTCLGCGGNVDEGECCGKGLGDLHVVALSVNTFLRQIVEVCE